MSFLQSLLRNVKSRLTIRLPQEIYQGLENVNYCAFASCFPFIDETFDISTSLFSENWQQQMESSEDMRSCASK